jgi:hypothetical protein
LQNRQPLLGWFFLPNFIEAQEKKYLFYKNVSFGSQHCKKEAKRRYLQHKQNKRFDAEGKAAKKLTFRVILFFQTQFLGKHPCHD